MTKKKREKTLTRAKAKLRTKKTQQNVKLIALKEQLSLEASLDRIRDKALSMKKPDDLLNICKALYTELQLFGFDALRNTMINIHNDDSESFLNYDYAKAGPSITHFNYHSHPVIEGLVRQMKRSRTAFSEHVLSGKKLEEFKAFRKSNGKKTDAKLRDAKALYYYFYSIGTGALGISNLAPLLPDHLKILKRFRNVFDLAYRRYADIQKADAYAREAQIQLALERVRARTIAMQHSNELPGAANLLFQQVQSLGIHAWSAGYCIWDENKEEITFWMCSEGVLQPPIKALVHEDPSFARFHEAWERGENFYVEEIGGEALASHYRHIRTLQGAEETLDAIAEAGFPLPTFQIFHLAYFTQGFLTFITFEQVPDAWDIFKRFAKVFEQTYTRFRDLQRAEVQAREAQIQLALERVRARTMAMQRSHELADVATILFQQVKALGVPQWLCGFSIWEIGDKEFTWYPGSPDGDILPPSKIPLTDHPVFISYDESRRRGDELFVYEKKGEVQADHYRYMLSLPGLGQLMQNMLDAGLQFPTFQIDHLANFSHGNLIFITYKHFPEMHDIFKRFAKVFEQTYTRFLDLQKAEARAREAQIEAALEKVRSRTMGMQKSEELKEIIQVVYEQFRHLNILIEHAGFIMDYKARNDMNIWLADPHDVPTQATIPYFDSPHWNSFNEAKEKGLDFFANHLSFEEKNRFYHGLFKLFPGVPEEAKEYYFSCPGLAISTVLLEDVGLYIENFSGIPYSDEENATLMRFGKVFQQTYTRFRDLQKVEAQAREAQIEAALERVRSRSLAMHRSDELREVVKAVFDKLQDLNFALEDGAVSIHIFKEHSRDHTQWIADPGHSYATPFDLVYSDHSIPRDLFTARESGVDYFSKIYPAEEKNEYFSYLFDHSSYRYLPDNVKELLLGSSQYGFSAAFTKHAAIVVPTNSGRLLTESEKEILKRFVNVFGQSYTRFLDLQKAEAQAREAQIETALEKVRSRSLAMHHSDELEQVVASLFDRLVELGLSFDGALIFIFQKEKRNIQLWIATNHLSVPVKIDLPYDEEIKNNAIIKDLWNAIENGEHIFNRSYSGETKNDYFRYVSKHNESKIPESVRKIQVEAECWTAYFAAEKNSIVGFDSWSGHKITSEDFQTLIRFARVFEQTYTRFLDLQKAEAQARDAQIESAVEKVRSRSLAMQKSTELREIVALIFSQMQKLGVDLNLCNILLVDATTLEVDYWVSFGEQEILPESYHIPYIDHPAYHYQLNAWRNESPFAEFELSGQNKASWDEYLMTQTSIKTMSESIKDMMRKFEKLFISSVAIKNGLVQAVSVDRLSSESTSVLQRFAKVFEQSYIRFLDLQKAEAQAREAKIEAALERVRSRSMAMHKSDELADLSLELVKQVQALGVATWFCAFNIYDEDRSGSLEWGSNGEGTFPRYRTPREGIFLRYYEVGQRGESFLINEIGENECAAHYEYLCTLPGVGAQLLKMKDSGIPFPTSQIDHVAYFKYGYLLFITYEPVSYAYDIFKRFAKVFEQTYTRFLDLQKAEAQAREAQIEAALERVRAKTMAMQKSDELADVAALIFQQVKELGITTWTTGFNVWSDDNNTYTDYVTSPLGGFIEPYTIDTTAFKSFKEISDAKKRGEEFYVQYLEGELLKETYLELSKFGDKDQYVKIREGGFEFPIRQFDHFVFLSNISLMFITYDPVPEAHDVFKRFGKVFEQTYTRFLDLQRAEAQAREAQIELALERVRARTMAMQKSSELAEAARLLYAEFRTLGINTLACGYCFVKEEQHEQTFWVTLPDGTLIHDLIIFPLTGDHVLDKRYEDWKQRKALHVFELQGEANKEHHRFLASKVTDQTAKEIFAQIPDRIIFYCANFSAGYLFIIAIEFLTAAEEQVIARFAKVFEQTYTRFLDLQKAEAQAREAQIEAALERIRSRALAMHTSGDLIDVANVLRDQMGLLGQPELESSIVHLYHDNSTTFEAWYAYRPPNRSNEKIITGTITVDRDCSEWSREALEKYASSDSEYTIISTGKKINEWYKVLEVIAPAVVEYDYLGQLIVPEILYYHLSKFSGGALLMISNQQPSAEVRELQRRAAVVFGLAVTRFFDLKRAEDQAREAKIEASLERVRGKAMAMHSSEDLAATIGIFYRELESFSITPRRCGVGLLNKETRVAELSTMNTTDKGDSIEVVGKLKMQGHPVLEGVYDGWISQQEYHPVLRGNEIKEYYQLVRPQISFPEYPNDAVQYGYFFFFPEGGVYAWTEKELAEDELKIYRRFTSVLSLTYKRYKDLRDAEIRTKEAVKQATLDRVRAEIASMRTKQDLDRITPLIWNELTILGIPFVRCGVFIMDDIHQQVHTFLSTPEGKAIAAFHLDYSVSNLKEAIRHWHDRQVYVTHWGEREFGELAGILLKQGSITSLDQYLNTLPTGGIHLHFLPFMQGMLYVGNTTQLQQEDIHLLQSLAEAFSTAYARYEDFSKLEVAKLQVDQALVELKQTQQQLVQSEKMASLGELTAGIAHEIQNPLNFVNNFSEVSNELIDEMVEEVKKGNFDEAKVIANDLKQNLEKINHHGKRADGIVKSMLQHSRTSSGQKELTDINVLCDEYLRLGYHGLRAKDKTFNAKFETKFDPTLEKINVIPQEIGRLILNLINNAFYAVTEKGKTILEGYEPTVSISTKKLKARLDDPVGQARPDDPLGREKVEIIVKDNGNGISQKVLDKIFQPFFTTKPTGQGTGLGLSLSYDIVKAHNGELKVETTEGVGSTFIVHLTTN